MEACERVMSTHEAITMDQQDNIFDSQVQEVNSEGPSIDILNDDCLERIFMYLTIPDRIRIERVCRRWKTVSLSSWRCMKEIILCNHKEWEFLWLHKRQKRKEDIFHQIMTKCGEFITHIEFEELYSRMDSIEDGESFKPSTKMYFDAIRSCPNITSVKGTTNVKHISQIIKEVATNSPKLKDFNLTGFLNTCENEVVELLHKHPNLECLTLTSELRSKHLFHLPKKIKKLVLYVHKGTGDDLVNALEQLECDYLKCLELKYCGRLSSENMEILLRLLGTRFIIQHLGLCFYKGIIQIPDPFSKFWALESIHLDHNRAVNDNVIVNLCRSCEKLSTISIAGCRITDRSIAALVTLPNLKTLDISQNDSITGTKLHIAKKLQSLKCRACTLLSHRSFCEVFTECLGLMYLDATACPLFFPSTYEYCIEISQRRYQSKRIPLLLKINSELKDFEDSENVPPILTVKYN